MEEAAARTCDNYVKDGVVPVASSTHRAGTSGFKGVSWMKGQGQWKVQYKGTYLGCHATAEAAAQVYNNYVKDGVDPITHRESTSRFKGVSWDTGRGLRSSTSQLNLSRF
jgi:hypothetical protein